MSHDATPGDDDPIEYEIHVEFEPYEERLQEFGIGLEEFEEALARAIDEHVEAMQIGAAGDEASMFEDIPVEIGNQTFRISELAEVVISTDAPISGEDADDESE